MELTIGNIKLSGNLILGPMAGVTDLPFRLLCKEKGADLVSTEMISAKGIMYNSNNTQTLLEVKEEERPVSLQLFGSDPDILRENAKRIEGVDFDILDINMGCPVPKVVNNNEGSALMKNPALVGKIVREVSRGINKPVTVKIRKGFDDDSINAVEIAKIIEDNGAAAVAVHGRTREEYYSGKADWDIIRQVKEAVAIPVIGSGDIFTPQAAKDMLEQTGCDGVMVARGAQGNPWIFNQIKAYLEDGVILNRPSFDEVAEMIIRHTKMSIDHKGDFTALREMRKHISWYTSGYKSSAKIRGQINSIKTLDELKELLGNYKSLLNND